MSQFLYVAAWVIASVFVGVTVGVYVGRQFWAGRHEKERERGRESTLKLLVRALTVMDDLAGEMNNHNSEIRRVGRHVGDLPTSGELAPLQRMLLDQVIALLKSNQRLEDDLLCARYQIEEQAQDLDRTRRQARRDPLSGVGSRMAFDEKLRWLLAMWNRERSPFALILADMNRFKWVNDTHGHPAGDRVLRQVGTLLKRTVREGDFVARYGGDEFAILLPHTDLETGIRIADRIRSETSGNCYEISPKEERVALGISLGVASARDGDLAETIILRADRALYHSKRTGRNQSYEPARDLETIAAESADLFAEPFLSER